MSKTPYISNNFEPLKTHHAASKNRRSQIGSLDFAQTVRTLRESMELALASSFMENSLGGSAESGSEFGMGLFGGPADSSLQMNMLMTLAKLSPQNSQPPASRTSLPTEADMRSQKTDTDSAHKPGELARKFESGGKGPGTIGYDRHGGTSYGTFQISSRQGTMKEFIDFIAEKAPEWASRLATSGPSDTGSVSGDFPAEWKRIAAEAPELFDELQRQFIEDSHYRPAVSNILATLGIGEEQLPPALKEVIFSTAVQHGPTGASRLFDKAYALLGDSGGEDMFRALIDNVYSLRGGQFQSSTESVRKAVASRFDRERELALAFLDGSLSSLA